MDYYTRLNNLLDDEYNDVIVYVELSKIADDNGESQILKDIAREEYIHAGHLERILAKAGKLVNSDSKEEATKALETV